MKVAALDLGSNSFLLLIADGENSKVGEVLSDHLEIVRLGQGVDQTKHLQPEALARAKECLEKFSKIIIENKVSIVKAVATSAARDAKNSSELFQIGSDLNIPIEVISGDREAEMTYKGSIFDQNIEKSYAVIDIGGGSTEIIIGKGQKYLFKKSINVGGVRFAERFIKSYPLTPEVLFDLEKAIAQEVEKVLLEIESKNIDELIAVAGTPTSLASVELGGFSEEKVHGYHFSRSSLLKWREKLAHSTIEEKISWGFQSKRADIIIVGVLVLLEIMKALRVNTIRTSTKGVRYGLAMELLKGERG